MFILDMFLQYACNIIEIKDYKVKQLIKNLIMTFYLAEHNDYSRKSY